MSKTGGSKRCNPLGGLSSAVKMLARRARQVVGASLLRAVRLAEPLRTGLVGSVLAAAVVVGGAHAPVFAGSRPNVVYVMADDMGYGDVACYNPASAASTPNIDALAANGIRFRNAHCPSAVCSPTRYSLLTGDHAFRVNREGDVQFNYGDVWIDSSVRTVGDMLGDNGYTTGMVGKWHLGFDVYDSSGNEIHGQSWDQNITPDWSRGLANGPSDRGFDYSYGHVASTDIPPYKWFETGQWVSQESVWHGGGPGPARAGWKDPDWDFNQVQRTIQNKSVEFINNHAQGDQPFFLYVPLSAPHLPVTPHPDYQGNTVDPYTDFVEEVDGVMGSIVSALESQGVLEDTLVIFTSDNGAKASEANFDGHQGTGVLDGTNLRGQKSLVYEGGHRAPFVARWGDGTLTGSMIVPGTVTDQIISLSDMPRTLAALTESPILPTEAVDSYDILAALLGDGSGEEVRDINISTSRYGMFAVTHKDEAGNEWKLIYSSGSGGYLEKPVGTRINPDQDFGDISLEDLQLYNLTTDLGEQNDLLVAGASDEILAAAESVHALMRNAITSGRSAPEQLVGDLDFDGDMDVIDWQAFKAGFSDDVGGLALIDAYQSGDLNLDGQIDVADFLAFKSSYDLANGVGSFETMTIPEPCSILVLAAGSVVLVRRRRPSRAVSQTESLS